MGWRELMDRAKAETNISNAYDEGVTRATSKMKEELEEKNTRIDELEQQVEVLTKQVASLSQTQGKKKYRYT